MLTREARADVIDKSYKRFARGDASCRLEWTRGGYTIVHKRLERGKFVFASQVTSDAKSVELDVHELSMLLEGIDVTRAKTSARWEPPKRSRVV